MIFDETESLNSDEINHLLSRLEKKNIKTKGKLKNKPVQSLWFKKDIVSTEILPSSNQEISQPSNGNENNSFDSDTSSPKYSNSESSSVYIYQNQIFDNDDETETSA